MEVYADALWPLDAEVIAILEIVPEDRRKMATNHEAFGYFADRYGRPWWSGWARGTKPFAAVSAW